MDSNSKNRLIKKYATLGILLLTIALPITLYQAQRNQDIRSNASSADKLEAEEGILSGNATSRQDSLASGGSYIEIGIKQTSSSFPFGPQEVAATPLSQGTKFASPNGSGTACSQASPCNIFTAANNAVGGDVVFLRGGVYNINDFVNLNKNTTTNYITFESYPGENAVLDGTNAPLVKDYIRLYGNYYKLRKFEVRNMPEQGIMIMGNHNIIDGIYAHHNKLSGVNIYSPSSITDGSMGSFNTIQNVTAVDNSDAGLTGGDFNDGGNADGIAISGGRDNLVLNVLVARNSDDGVDSWRSANSRIAYSIATGNGLANGNGIGFKLGGIAPSGNTQVDHSIAYDNRTGNFDPNGGENVTMLNITSYNSRDYGVYAYPTTTIRDSISVGSPKGNIVGQNGPTTGTQTNNSWQRSGTPSFISTDPNNQNFLRPTTGGGFEDIGAWAGTISNTPSPIACPSNLQTAITNTPTGGTLDITGCSFTISSPVTISKAMTLQGGTISTTTKAIVLGSNNITISGVHITGPQYTSFNSIQNAIFYDGATIQNIIIKNNIIENFGQGGIWIGNISNLNITGNTIKNIVYAGIMIISGNGGSISTNNISNIGVTGYEANGMNAYGIALTDTLGTPSTGITISGNIIDNVPQWHGLDTHGGRNLIFSGNTIHRTNRAIFLTGSDSSNGPVQNITVSQNIMDTPTKRIDVINTYPYNEVGITAVAGSINVSGTGNKFDGWPAGNHIDTQGGPNNFTNNMITNPQ